MKKSKKEKPPRPQRMKRLRAAGKAPRDERWEIFCLEYTKDFNATRAYAEAFKGTRGTARAEGCKLLTNPYIKQRIGNIVAERKARVLAEGDEILLEIKKLATSDITRLIDPETGCLIPATDWPDDLKPAVASFEVIESFNPFTGELTGYVKKLKFWDKPKSLEMLGKNKKLFGDDAGKSVQVTVVTADKEQIRAIMKEIEDEC